MKQQNARGRQSSKLYAAKGKYKGQLAYSGNTLSIALKRVKSMTIIVR